MSLLRWLPTFLAFPLGGFVSLLLFGSSASAWAALGGGLVVGASIGAAQWLALGRIAGLRWFLVTTGAVSAGSVLAWLVVGPPTTPSAAAATGLLVGASVGIAQSVALAARPLARAAWAVAVALSWTLGWVVTAFVIVDLDRGHFIFGSSGAFVVTVITGLVLRAILGRRVRPRADPDATPAMEAAAAIIAATTTATRGDS